MYAVIETGGKQYRVEVGTELQVELLDVEPGKTITLDRVLLVADGDQASIGQPLVANAAVSAEVVRQARGDKVISFKYRPKARRRVKHGHRQELTVLRISDITLGSKSAAKAKEKAAADAALAEQLASRTKANDTETETEAKPKRSRAEAAPAEAEAETASEAPTEAEATKPKRTRAKAAEPEAESKTEATAEAETEATEATEAKPKRRRTTKKDE